MSQKPRPVCLISSVDFESSRLRGYLKGRRVKTVSGFRYTAGTLGRHTLVCVESGVGKANAASAAAVMIAAFNPACVVNFGVAGAYPRSGLANGDVAVAASEIYGDEGVEEHRGFADMKAIGFPLLKRGRTVFYNEFPMDRTLGRKLLAAAKRSCGRDVKQGPFVTVSSCSGTKKQALRIGTRLGALCENMEGAAVAHVCARYRVPAAEVRGISNIAGDRNRKRWDLSGAAENCQNVLLAFFES